MTLPHRHPEPSLASQIIGRLVVETLSGTPSRSPGSTFTDLVTLWHPLAPAVAYRNLDQKKGFSFEL